MGFHPGPRKEEKAEPDFFLWCKRVASRNSNRSRPCNSGIEILSSGDFCSSWKWAFSQGASLLSGSCWSYGSKHTPRQHWGHETLKKTGGPSPVSSFIPLYHLKQIQDFAVCPLFFLLEHLRVSERSRISSMNEDSPSVPLAVTWETVSCSMSQLPPSYLSLQVLISPWLGKQVWLLNTWPIQFDIILCKWLALRSKSAIWSPGHTLP